MRLHVTIRGATPLLQHSTRGMVPGNPLKAEQLELTRKKGSDRTATVEARIQQIDSELALWLDHEDRITIPAGAIRANIEGAARKLKQGPDVRGGLVVESDCIFHYDPALGDTPEDVAKNAMFTVPVVVSRAKTLRSRPKFDQWSAEFTLDCDDTLISEEKVLTWLDIGGRQIGVGDWRPEKSGHYGRFAVESIEVLE